LELIVRGFLHRNGFRYRLHDVHLPGKPDIVFKKYKTVIFINGCYFHGHKNCRLAKIPESRTVFWEQKIMGNAERDAKIEEKLILMGWNVIKIWECEVEPRKKNSEKREVTFETLKKNLSKILHYDTCN
jgi:DNA mismatch endonuclease (patch repair protein)